jgi:G3E family GTPase
VSRAADFDVGALLVHAAPATRFRSSQADDPAGTSHAARIRSFVVTVSEPLDWTAFGIWLTMLLQARGADLLRVKGLLNVAGPEADDSGPLLLNGVQHVVHPPEHLDAWPDEDRRSRIVFIGRGLDRADVERSLLAFDAAAH